MSAPGRFLVVEGIDGAGTTTLSRALAAALEARGTPARWTCEPTAGAVGRLIRSVLRREVELAPADRDAHDAMMALLFAADRREHLAIEIEPALASGTWIVSDRYYHSTLAYQGRGEAFERIRSLHQGWARVPDLTLLVELPAPAAEGRRRSAARDVDEIYDALETQEGVAARYHALLARLGEPMVAIDGAQPPGAVLAAAMAAVEEIR